MTVYLLPATNQTCVSYTISSDILFIYSHLRDKFTKITVRRQGYQTFTGTVAPMIFQQGLNILNPAERFKITLVDFAKIWLQATKVVENEIYVTPNKRDISNIRENFSVCWGGNFVGVKSMRGMIDKFFGSPFNGDLCGPERTMRNCTETRREVNTQQFVKSPYKLISKDANALYILYNSDNIANFFKMSCAGFKPLPENKNIMIIPLKETILTYEGTDYHGFLTPLDNCKKKWFILPNSKIVGQYNYSTMSIREPEFPPIPSSQVCSPVVEDEDEEEEFNVEEE